MSKLLLILLHCSSLICSVMHAEDATVCIWPHFLYPYSWSTLLIPSILLPSCLSIRCRIHGTCTVQFMCVSSLVLCSNFYFCTLDSICPTFGGSNPGLQAEVIHSMKEKLSLICGCACTSYPSAYASISVSYCHTIMKLCLSASAALVNFMWYKLESFW